MRDNKCGVRRANTSTHSPTCILRRPPRPSFCTRHDVVSRCSPARAEGSDDTDGVKRHIMLLIGMRKLQGLRGGGLLGVQCADSGGSSRVAAPLSASCLVHARQKTHTTSAGQISLPSFDKCMYLRSADNMFDVSLLRDAACVSHHISHTEQKTAPTAGHRAPKQGSNRVRERDSNKRQ